MKCGHFKTEFAIGIKQSHKLILYSDFTKGHIYLKLQVFLFYQNIFIKATVGYTFGIA